MATARTVLYFKDCGTRDLVESNSPNVESEQQTPFSIALTFIKVLLKALTKAFDDQPPPLKSSLSPDVNLTARLLPAPTLTSA